MQIFRYKADRVPVAIIFSLFVLDLLVYFFATQFWMVLAWFAITVFPKFMVCAWNHHHQHTPTFKQLPLNRLLELVYTLHTGITTNAWVLHHVLGHHVNYLDQSKDESAWARKDGSTMGATEYTATIAATGYVRAFRVGKDHPRYQRAFLSMGVLAVILLAGLLYSNWVNAFFVFVLPMLIGYICTCWHTYYHHAGLHTDDPLQGSYNIMDKWYNLATGNLGYHTAHHMKQGLHWSKLPEYHEEIKDKIPVHLYRAPCFPFNLLPSHAGKRVPAV